MTSGSLWNYYGDDINNSAHENNDTNNYRINNKKLKKVNLLSMRQK